jgi:hypothetical protein
MKGWRSWRIGFSADDDRASKVRPLRRSLGPELTVFVF